MTIALTQDQQAWIAEQVARGRFASVEAAASQLIDERIFELTVKDDELAWAKPLVDEALTDVAAGRVMSLGEHEARMDALIASLTT